jgi:hypothetical protein
MDKSILALLKLLRRKVDDRILKLNRGKWNRHVHGIGMRQESKNKSIIININKEYHLIVTAVPRGTVYSCPTGDSLSAAGSDIQTMDRTRHELPEAFARWP